MVAESDDNIGHNPFIWAKRSAELKNWCTRYGCTTCGAHQFRDALRAINRTNPGGLVHSLATADLSEIRSEPKGSRSGGWQDELCIAFYELGADDARDNVLWSWLDRIDGHVRIADVILFNCFRRSVFDDDLSRAWWDVCIRLAIETLDYSLIESMILIRPSAVAQIPELVEFAKKQVDKFRVRREAIDEAVDDTSKYYYRLFTKKVRRREVREVELLFARVLSYSD